MMEYLCAQYMTKEKNYQKEHGFSIFNIWFPDIISSIYT